MGVDRELGLFLGLVVFALVFVAFSILKLVVAILAWTAGMWALRRMAKADPMMRHIYFRYIRYPKNLGARSTPWRRNNDGQVNHYRIPE